MSESGQVSCDLPRPSLIPQTPEDQGMAFIINLHPLSMIVFNCNQSGQSDEMMPQEAELYAFFLGITPIVDMLQILHNKSKKSTSALELLAVLCFIANKN